MFNWITKLKESSSETKMFVLTVIILVIIVFGTLIYSYARLESARSTKPAHRKEATQLR